MNKLEEEQRFLQDVDRHVMTVLRDDGVHRHLRFKRPDSGTYWFNLITWPGTLCIDGDCGTFVFRRTEDMFEFFRANRGSGDKLYTNLGYWSEKLVSTSRRGVTEFSPDIFREAVRDEFDAWVESEEPVDAVRYAVWSDVVSEVLSRADEGEHAAFAAAMEFDSNAGSFQMCDFWEHDCTEWQFHFVWCCFAIAWGIREYDAAFAKEVA